MKKILTGLLLLLLLILPFRLSAAEQSGPESGTEEDITAPILHSIEVSPQSIQVPGSFQVILDAEDDLSGIMTAEVNFSAGEDGDIRELIGRLAYDEKSQKYLGTIEADAYEPGGLFRLMYVVLEDQANNRAIYRSQYMEYADPPFLPQEAVIEVINPDSQQEDRTPPVLLSISADRTELKAPGSFCISAEITDDLSGVAYADVDLKAGTKPDSPSIHGSLSYNSQSQRYEGSFQIAQADAGLTYAVTRVRLEDGTGNVAVYSNQPMENASELQLPDNLSIQVSPPPSPETEPPETKPPETKPPETNPPETKPPETEAPETKPPETEAPETKPPETKPPETEPPETKPPEETTDTLGPTLLSVEADKIEVTVPGEIHFTAAAEDDLSGVISAGLQIGRKGAENGNASDRPLMLTKNPKTGNFEGILALTESEPAGELFISQAELRDDAGNVSVYHSSERGEIFGPLLPREVSIRILTSAPQKQDREGPVLYAMEADPKEITVPGRIYLRAKAEDSLSGIRSILVRLARAEADGALKTRDLFLTESQIPGAFEGILDLTEYDSAGEWFVLLTDLTDQAGNVSSYHSESAPELPGKRLPTEVFFRINIQEPEKQDEAGPVLKSLTLDREKVTAPGSFLVKAEAEDDLSGIKSVLVRLGRKTPDGSLKTQDLLLALNEKTGCYEGSFSLDRYEPSGEIHIILAELTDFAGNVSCYHSEHHTEISGPLLPREVSVTVKNLEAAQKNILILQDPVLLQQPGAWVDGIYFPVKKDEDLNITYLDLGREDFTSLTIYSWHADQADPHTQYPTGMKVWLLTCSKGTYQAEYVPEYDNLLQYSGSSIRIRGKKGIRMITSMEKAKKEALIQGNLAGSRLLEYGTALSWQEDLEKGNPLILGAETARTNFAYRAGEADPVFKDTGDLIQYTNVLVGFREEECGKDLAMRPYIILEDRYGRNITLYGGIVRRSIGYIAWQNRNAFSVGSEAHQYVSDLIRLVYGK